VFYFKFNPVSLCREKLAGAGLINPEQLEEIENAERRFELR